MIAAVVASMAATAAIHEAEQTHLHFTHTLTHQGVWSCSANAVLQDAVISVRAAERVKTLRSEISIAGWDLTVQRGGENGRIGERWCCENKKKAGVEAECEIQMLQLGEGSAMIEQRQILLAALLGRCGSSKSNRKVFSSADIKGRIKQQGYWITINICSLPSLSVPPGSGQ